MHEALWHMADQGEESYGPSEYDLALALSIQITYAGEYPTSHKPSSSGWTGEVSRPWEFANWTAIYWHIYGHVDKCIFLRVNS